MSDSYIQSIFFDNYNNNITVNDSLKLNYLIILKIGLYNDTIVDIIVKSYSYIYTIISYAIDNSNTNLNNNSTFFSIKKINIDNAINNFT